MRYLLLAALLALLPLNDGQADSLKIAPAVGAFDGIPLPIALAHLDFLGTWNLPDSGRIQVFSTRGLGYQPGCELRDTDPERCHTLRFYLSIGDLFSEISSDYSLFRGPAGVWRLPTIAPFKIMNRDLYILQLCGDQAAKSSSWGTMADYVVTITRKRTSNKKFLYTVKLEKKNERGDFLNSGGCVAFDKPPPPISIKPATSSKSTDHPKN